MAKKRELYGDAVIEQLLAWLKSARSKTDLEDWKPSSTFHLDRARREAEDGDHLD